MHRQEPKISMGSENRTRYRSHWSYRTEFLPSSAHKQITQLTTHMTLRSKFTRNIQPINTRQGSCDLENIDLDVRSSARYDVGHLSCCSIQFAQASAFSGCGC